MRMGKGNQKKRMKRIQTMMEYKWLLGTANPLELEDKVFLVPLLQV
jgi:hypothetical protein